MTILVVEDVAVNAIILRNILERAEYRVITAGDGVEALEVLERETHVDLALVDVHMPRKNGLDLVRDLRARPETAELPVVFITSESDAKVVREAVNLGSLGYILKPIVEPSRVLQQVERALASIPHVIAPAEQTMRGLGIGRAVYSGLLDAFREQVAAARAALQAGRRDDPAFEELAESARQLGADRLARWLESGGPKRENAGVPYRELDSVLAELTRRGITGNPACPTTETHDEPSPSPASPSEATSSTASVT